jgi:tyrosinase
LTPFRSSDGGWWTSDSSRSTETFGYTYPELSNKEDVAAIRSAVNSLYGPRPSGRTRKRTVSSSTETRREYVTNVRASKHGLGSTFSISVFVGEQQVYSSYSNENLAGTHAVFNSPSTPRQCLVYPCDDDALVTGAVPLTVALEKKVRDGLLRSLDPEDVVPFLAKELNWLVRKVRLSH